MSPKSPTGPVRVSLLGLLPGRPLVCQHPPVVRAMTGYQNPTMWRASK